jgi:low temperature requirement protein LtrA
VCRRGSDCGWFIGRRCRWSPASLPWLRATGSSLPKPTQPAGVATASILLGGTAIFLAGHALFKLAIWHHVSRSHFAAIILLLLLIPIAVNLPGLAVAALVIVGLGVMVAALRGQAPATVPEAVRPATDVD